MKRKMRNHVFFMLMMGTLLCGCNTTEYAESQGNIDNKVFAAGSSTDEEMSYIIEMEDASSSGYLHTYYQDYTFEYTYKNHEENVFSNYMIVEAEKYQVNIYDLKSNKKVETIDVIEKAKEFVDLDKYQFSISGCEGIVKREGHLCILIKMEEIPTEEELKSDIKIPDMNFYDLYLGIKSDYGYMDENPSTKPRYTTTRRNKVAIINYTNIVENNTSLTFDESRKGPYFSYSPYWYQSEADDICIVSIELNILAKLSEDNIRLYEKMPEIKEYLETEDLYYEDVNGKKRPKELTLYVKGKDWRELLGLFMAEGKEISLDNITIFAEDSIDGQEHVVHSEEEFNQYYKFDEDEYYGGR